MPEITNKEAVAIIIKELKENASIEDIYRLVANYFIDCSRMVRFNESVLWIGTQKEKKEFTHFMNRMALNTNQLQNALKGSGLSLVEMPLDGEN